MTIRGIDFLLEDALQELKDIPSRLNTTSGLEHFELAVKAAELSRTVRMRLVGLLRTIKRQDLDEIVRTIETATDAISYQRDHDITGLRESMRKRVEYIKEMFVD